MSDEREHWVGHGFPVVVIDDSCEDSRRIRKDFLRIWASGPVEDSGGSSSSL